MARLTKESDRRIWVAFRHPTNHTLSVTGFSDVMEAMDGLTFNVVETAEQKSKAFLSITKGSRIMEGAKTAEEAFQMARDQRF